MHCHRNKSETITKESHLDNLIYASSCFVREFAQYIKLSNYGESPPLLKKKKKKKKKKKTKQTHKMKIPIRIYKSDGNYFRYGHEVVSIRT